MTTRPELAVTTSASAAPADVAEALALASAWGLPFASRPRKGSVSAMVGVAADRLLVVGGDGLSLWDRGGGLQFSLGMAQLRIKRLDQGFQDDALVRWGALTPGDAVLDCTLGLGADALVAARAVGVTGRVVGLEKSRPLCVLVSEGIRRSVRRASASIDVVHAEALEYLSTLEDGTFDCVLFDPMFDQPRRASHAFDALRRHADYAPLTEALLSHGRRVARRWVLVKGARYSSQWARLALSPQAASRHSPVVWARLPGVRAPASACG